MAALNGEFPRAEDPEFGIWIGEISDNAFCSFPQTAETAFDGSVDGLYARWVLSRSTERCWEP